MRQIMDYDGEFRREEGLPQSALTQSTDGGSGRREAWAKSPPPPRWTGRGVICGRKRPLKNCGHPKIGA